jgi:hypothetical protein
MLYLTKSIEVEILGKKSFDPRQGPYLEHGVKQYQKQATAFIALLQCFNQILIKKYRVLIEVLFLFLNTLLL